MKVATYSGMLMKRAVVSVGLAVGVLSVLGVASGFLIAALYIWLDSMLGPAPAAAIVGGYLMFVALFLAAAGALILRRMRRRTPKFMSVLVQSFSTAINLGGLLVRAGPKRVMLIALVAGAVAEYISSRDKMRG